MLPAALLLAFSTLQVPATLEQEAPPEEIFGEEITVSLTSIPVRVLDAKGQPIQDLKPEDFVVRLHRQEIPVAAVDWVAFEEEETAPVPRLEGGERVRPEPAPAGKLVVFFVQADLHASRISGQLRLRRHTRDLLATLGPNDRAAVVSYDSHLKLRLDFTRDLEAVHTAIDRGMLYTREERGLAAGEPSLARYLDAEAAKRAATPERALEVTANALERLPGKKGVVFLGWGIGRMTAFGVKPIPDYLPAVQALARARARVFVLDITSADYHSLEIGLNSIAEATGGTYGRTFRFPGLATGMVASNLAGHYVLRLDPAQVPEGRGRLTIGLRGQRGTVVAPPVTVR